MEPSKKMVFLQSFEIVISVHKIVVAASGAGRCVSLHGPLSLYGQLNIQFFFSFKDACHERPRGGRCQCVSHRPPVPKHDDPAPIPYPPSQSNYVSYNAKHVADVANYHDIKPQMVDSKDGHVMNLEKSGLVPQFVKKPVLYLPNVRFN